MDLGGKIKNYRIRCGMDQKTLAQHLNVSPKTVSSWEVNRTEPKMEMIEAMCNVFGCNKSDFLDEEPRNIDNLFIKTLASKEHDRIAMYARLLNAASKCTPEEINALITLLERQNNKKEDQ